jgi:hypothetical protein
LECKKQILLKVLAAKEVPSNKIQRWYQEVIGQVLDDVVTYDTFVTVYKCEGDQPKRDNAVFPTIGEEGPKFSQQKKRNKKALCSNPHWLLLDLK